MLITKYIIQLDCTLLPLPPPLKSQPHCRYLTTHAARCLTLAVSLSHHTRTPHAVSPSLSRYRIVSPFYVTLACGVVRWELSEAQRVADERSEAAEGGLANAGVGSNISPHTLHAVSPSLSHYRIVSLFYVTLACGVGLTTALMMEASARTKRKLGGGGVASFSVRLTRV